MGDVTDRVDTRQLAAILHCSVDKARDLMGTAIPATFNGRAYTAARADVEQYIRRTTITKASQKPRKKRRRPTTKD